MEMKVKTASSSRDRKLGLMFKLSLPKDSGLLLVSNNGIRGIHMMFMFLSLDVVFLDKRDCILKVYHNVKPWSKFMFVKGAYKVLEVKAGVCREYGLEEGMTLNFEDKGGGHYRLKL